MSIFDEIDFSIHGINIKIPLNLIRIRSGGTLVPMTGVEPVRIISPRDFKSLVSAYSTTSAFITVILYYLSRDLSSRFHENQFKTTTSSELFHLQKLQNDNKFKQKLHSDYNLITNRLQFHLSS